MNLKKKNREGVTSMAYFHEAPPLILLRARSLLVRPEGGGKKQRGAALHRSLRRHSRILEENEREGSTEKALAHLPVPVAWQMVTGRRRILPRKWRQNTMVTGDEEDGG